jgi:hypothetical protein
MIGGAVKGWNLVLGEASKVLLRVLLLADSKVQQFGVTAK